MVIEEKKVQDFENKYKTQLFEGISTLSDQQAELLKNVQTIAGYTGIRRELPNIGITLNNKIIELSHEFRDAGISMFSSKTENYGQLGLSFVGTSFIGEALIENMVEIMTQGNEALGEYEQTIEEIMKKKQTQHQELEKAGPIKRMFYRIKALVSPSKKIASSFTKEEGEQLDSILSDYSEKDKKLFGYNIRDNIVESLVKYIKQKGYSKEQISGIVEECIAEDLQKLGLANLIPELNHQLEKEFEKEETICGNLGELSPEAKRMIQQEQQRIAKMYAEKPEELGTYESLVGEWEKEKDNP